MLLSNILNEQKELQKEIDKQTEAVSEFTKCVESFEKLNQLHSEEVELTESVTTYLAAKQQREQIKEEVIRLSEELDELTDGVCPTCGKPFDDEHC